MVRKKKVTKKRKPRKKAPRQARGKGPKVLGKILHFFGKIGVAALEVKSPIKVGDMIHIKGHTTNFVQKIESMQIEHQDVQRVKRGDDVGIKVREKVRENDIVYLSQEKEIRLLGRKNLLLPRLSKPLSEKKESGSYSNIKFLNF